MTTLRMKDRRRAKSLSLAVLACPTFGLNLLAYVLPRVDGLDCARTSDSGWDRSVVHPRD